MATFSVHVTIENKPGISDPEGDTILNDLVLKGTHKTVSKIKTAKMLKFTIKEKDKKTAQSKIQEICDDLRIYNPMVSKVISDVFENRAPIQIIYNAIHFDTCSDRLCH